MIKHTHTPKLNIPAQPFHSEFQSSRENAVNHPHRRYLCITDYAIAHFNTIINYLIIILYVVVWVCGCVAQVGAHWS